MDLIERYVFEVGRHLPAGLRADVEAELRSLLAESVEERARAAGRAADEQMVAGVLREFGKPRDAASRYAPRQECLIGPSLYPAFRTIVKVAVPIYGLVTLVLLALGYYARGGEPATLDVLARATGSFLSGTLFNLGLLTIVFAIVERAMHEERRAGTQWDPAKLPPVNDPDRISYFGRVFLLYCIAAVALVVNFHPDWLAFASIGDDGVRVTPLLEPGFSRYVPFLNVAWALAFILNLVVVRQGRWRTPTRWAEFVLDACNAAILLAIVVGPPVFRYHAVVRQVLQAVLVVMAIRSGVQLYRLVTRRPFEPWRAAAAK